MIKKEVKEAAGKKIEEAVQSLSNNVNLGNLSEVKTTAIFEVLSKELKAKDLFNAIKCCLDNSSRLYEDAKMVSAPTKCALVELSLEEAVKAHQLVLLYQYLFPNLKVPSWYDKDLKASNEAVKNTNCAELLHSIFTRHDLKTYLASGIFGVLGNFMEAYDLIMLEVLKKTRPQEEMNKIKSVMKEFEEILTAISKIDLNKIKKGGFYVDLDFKTGRFYAPQGIDDETALLLGGLRKIYLGLIEEFLQIK